MNDQSIIRANANGDPAIHGTRLTVYSIMDHYLTGASLEEIADFYRVTVGEAACAIDYINSHMAELMPAYRKMLERDSRGNSPEVTERLRQSHERFNEFQNELKGKRGRARDASVTG